jgi:predicted acyltransferase
MTAEKNITGPAERLVSLDVFRGITIAAMILVNNPGSWDHVFPQLRHASWNGWTLTDLIFPFFLFIVGVAIVFAFSKRIDRKVTKISLYLKIIRRTLIIFLLGLFLNAFPDFDLATLRIPGVLQRIAICYLIASLIYLNTRSAWKGLSLWAVLFLLLYWLMMAWIPVPEMGSGIYKVGKNFSNYIDSILLQGHMWAYTVTWDPEGIISTLPAISTTLFGVLTGNWLKSNKSLHEKALGMLMAGNAGLLLGIIWDNYLPINKSIWTSSYTVLTAGLALICLAFCFYYIDVQGKRKWIQPALVFGSNAIAAYVLSGILADVFISVIKYYAADGTIRNFQSWLYERVFSSWLDPLYGSLAYALCFVLLIYLILLFLYKKRIFIKV